MRFEQIITAVARQVVVSTVREIKAVMSFLNGGWPHFSQQRNANGVPSYANGLYLLPAYGTVVWLADPSACPAVRVYSHAWPVRIVQRDPMPAERV